MSTKPMAKTSKSSLLKSRATSLFPGNPTIHIENSRYRVHFAENAAELDAALKLRFEVFNLELGEGLSASFETMRDQDEFDNQCHHLLVTEKDSNRIIATYRMQTLEMAKNANGFYSDGEFVLSMFPKAVITNAVEVGRACIARTHRNGMVLFMLWKGIAKYMLYARKRYLFGCCSLTSQDPLEGKQLMEQLKASGQVHQNIQISPQPGFECYPEDQPFSGIEAVKLPKLFRIYLNYGAKVCGPPAIDRAFKTIDYLVLLDVGKFDSRTYNMFFD